MAIRYGKLPRANIAGTRDFNDLINKPRIDGNVLIGDKTSAVLGLASRAWTSDEIAAAQLANQHWLPSVATVALLPATIDPAFTWLCRVMSDPVPANNGVYQAIPNGVDNTAVWTLFGGNEDFVSQQEMEEALAGLVVTTNYYIDASTGVDNDDTDRGLSAGLPYATISYALAAIKAKPAAHNTILHLAAGTYTESVEIGGWAGYLTIQGDNGDPTQTIVQCPVPTAGASNTFFIYGCNIRFNNIHLKNLNATNCRCIYVRDFSYCWLYNCITETNSSQSLDLIIYGHSMLLLDTCKSRGATKATIVQVNIGSTLRIAGSGHYIDENCTFTGGVLTGYWGSKLLVTNAVQLSVGVTATGRKYVLETGAWLTGKTRFPAGLTEGTTSGGALVQEDYKYEPDKWTANVEINFGDGTYGQRFTGNIVAAAGAAIGTILINGTTTSWRIQKSEGSFQRGIAGGAG